jgi:hypothetical protein
VATGDNGAAEISPCPAGATTLRSAKKMKSTRVTLGIVVSLVGWTILFSLWAVRYDFKWNSLGEWYRTAAKVADVELPVLIRLFWPIAPAAWWGWLSPAPFGICAAFAVRAPWSLSGQLAALFGAVFLAGVVWSTVVTYTRMTFYMGSPLPEPIEVSSLKFRETEIIKFVLA